MGKWAEHMKTAPSDVAVKVSDRISEITWFTGEVARLWAGGLALAGFEAPVGLVDDVYATAAAHHPAIPVAIFDTF